MTGPIRHENQDSIVADGIVGLKSGSCIEKHIPIGDGFAVAVVDGMGGYEGGADAAALAACAIAQITAEDAKDLNRFFNHLSERIGYAGGAWFMPNMGAAVAMVYLKSQSITVSNVGDSRVYRLENGHLGQWSKDDRLRPGSTAITQSLGGAFQRIDAHVVELRMEDTPQRFLLCTDGVWSTLGDEALERLCIRHAHPPEVAKSIIDECLRNNAADNCSAIVVDISAAAM